MPATEAIARLGEHWCPIITDRLDPLSHSTDPISSGDFGDVHRGALANGRKVLIQATRIPVKSNDDQKSLKNVARRILTLSTLDLPNVRKLLGLVEFRNQIGMVYDWIENGSLPAYLEQHPDVDRCRMSQGICYGLRHLHDEDIVHGDLRGINVLIDGDGTPRIANFENATLLKLTGTAATTKLSPRWAAPELVEGHSTCSFAADVYSLGMTILETITGKVPYFDKTELEISKEKGLPLRPDDFIPSNSQDGNKLWKLLLECWAYEPENRPSALSVWKRMREITSEGLTIPQAEGIAE